MRQIHQSCKREDGFETSHSTLPATDEVHEALASVSLSYLKCLSRDSIHAECIHILHIRPEGVLSGNEMIEAIAYLFSPVLSMIDCSLYSQPFACLQGP